jgi:hypothetical protein
MEKKRASFSPGIGAEELMTRRAELDSMRGCCNVVIDERKSSPSVHHAIPVQVGLLPYFCY